MTGEEAKDIMDDAWVHSDGNLHKFIEFIKEKVKDTDEYKMRKNDARHGHKEEDPAQTTDKPIDRTRLKESEKQFNDALLDEQAKRIENQKKVIGMLQDKLAEADGNYKYTLEKNADFQKKVKEMGKQIAHLNEAIGKKNAEIKDLKIDLEEKEDLLECYRFSDKNKEDMISGLKKVNEGLRHQLAKATISKVNEQALKSAESALVYKDGVIGKLKKECRKRREKIEELSKKLEATEKARKEYCDYGVGANNFIKKICSAYVNAHERGVYSLEALFAGRKYNNGLPPKDAFEYAKEEKARNKKKNYTGVDVGSEEGDKGYVGAFAIYNEVPVGEEVLTEERLYEIVNSYFKSPIIPPNLSAYHPDRDYSEFERKPYPADGISSFNSRV